MENNNENIAQNEFSQGNNVETIVSDAVASKESQLQSDAKADKSQVHRKTGHRRILEGRVVSNKPDKTIVVLVERYVQHPLYKKYFKRSKKFMAHDEHNECQVGDLVRIIEWRPLSRRKRWMLKEIVERAK
jgi:small subunit ribosomal protein S17